MNSEFMHRQSEALAARLLREESENRPRLERAYRSIYARPPSPEDLQKAEDFLAQVSEKLKSAGSPAEDHPRMALASYLRAMLSSNEFLFVD
jgi:hypothetical protein